MSRTAFLEACSLYASGVAVVTVLAADGTPHGLTVSSFTSVSLEPPLILACIDNSCTCLPHLRSCTHFAVNVLSESQRDVSVTFAIKPEGRFDDVEWYAKETGAPLLRDSLATIECRIASITDAGDHVILLGQVLDADSRSGEPLLYFHRNYRSLR